MSTEESNRPIEHNVRHVHERPFATFQEIITSWEHCLRKISETRDTEAISVRYQIMADSLQASLQELLVAHVKQNVVLNAIDEFNKNEEPPSDDVPPQVA